MKGEERTITSLRKNKHSDVNNIEEINLFIINTK
jgi:hypothetical protein